MKQAEDNKTAELPGLGRRGRRPAGERAMTPAERQRAYRLRLAEERFSTKTAEVSRVTILQQLAQCMGQLDKGFDIDRDIYEGAQYWAEGLIAEIVTRYDLSIPSIKRKAKA